MTDQVIEHKIEQWAEEASTWSIEDRLRLIARLASPADEDNSGGEKKPRKSLYGLWADLGTAPSAEEIDEIRREMWKNFPREDI